MWSEVSTDSTLTEWSSGSDCPWRTQSITWPDLWVGSRTHCSKSNCVKMSLIWLILWSQSHWKLKYPRTSIFPFKVLQYYRKSRNCSKNRVYESLFFLLGGGLYKRKKWSCMCWRDRVSSRSSKELWAKANELVTVEEGFKAVSYTHLTLPTKLSV